MGDTNTAPATDHTSQAPKKRKNWLGTALIILLILALLGGLGYVSKLYLDTHNKLISLQDSAASQVDNLTPVQVQALVQEVGRHIMLPADKPQVVTITNVDQLKIGQPFFDPAQNGDKLLVYMTKVILYRASIDKVIDVAQIRPPANTTATNSAQTATPTVTPKVSTTPTRILTPTPTPAV